MRDHIDRCHKEEAERFGVASRCELDVTTSNDGTVLHVSVVADPTPEVAEAYGQTYQNPSPPSSEPARKRFWLSDFEFRYDSDINVIAFYRQREHRWVCESATLLNDNYFNIWEPRQVAEKRARASMKATA